MNTLPPDPGGTDPESVPLGSDSKVGSGHPSPSKAGMEPGDSPTLDGVKLAQEIRHHAAVSRTHADKQLRRAHESLSGLGILMRKHGSSFHDLVAHQIPKSMPGYQPDPGTLQTCRELDELISVSSLPPLRPPTFLSRIITQRI